MQNQKHKRRKSTKHITKRRRTTIFRVPEDIKLKNKLELDIDKVKKILGMDITIVTSAKTTEEGKALLNEFGFPFAKK